jgi:hypothetical protein
VGHVKCMGRIRNVYNILVGKSERNKRLGIPGNRWEDNIKMDLKIIGYEIVD